MTENNLENRACQLTREFIGHAIKVRGENPEYAQSPEQTCMILGMELSRIANSGDQGQQQDVLNRLRKGLNQLRLNESEKDSIFSTLAPQIVPGYKPED